MRSIIPTSSFAIQRTPALFCITDCYKPKVCQMFLAAFRFILFRQPAICQSGRGSFLVGELAYAPTATPPWFWLIEIEAIS